MLQVVLGHVTIFNCLPTVKSRTQSCRWEFLSLEPHWGAMAGLFSWGTSDVILFKSFFLGRSCSPEKRLPGSWLGRVKACMASFLKAGGGEDWGFHIWFACASLTLPFSVWHPCLWLYLVFPSPDTPHLPLSLNSE